MDANFLRTNMLNWYKIQLSYNKLDVRIILYDVEKMYEFNPINCFIRPLISPIWIPYGSKAFKLYMNEFYKFILKNIDNDRFHDLGIGIIDLNDNILIIDVYQLLEFISSNKFIHLFEYDNSKLLEEFTLMIGIMEERWNNASYNIGEWLNFLER